MFQIALDDTLTLNVVPNDSVSTKLTLSLNVDENMCIDFNRTQNFVLESPKSSQGNEQPTYLTSLYTFFSRYANEACVDRRILLLY